MTTLKTIFSELELIDNLVFRTCGIEMKNVETELESQEYFAHNFQLAKKNVKFRIAKITPTKTGQFVTIWKRNEQGITEPFHILDDIDFYIIATRKATNFGLFIFPKTVLYENKILSDKIRDGKRGIRVYPTWDLTASKQAQKTQHWQTKYFIDLSIEMQIDIERLKSILQIDK